MVGNLSTTVEDRQENKEYWSQVEKFEERQKLYQSELKKQKWFIEYMDLIKDKKNIEYLRKLQLREVQFSSVVAYIRTVYSDEFLRNQLKEMHDFVQMWEIYYPQYCHLTPGDVEEFPVESLNILGSFKKWYILKNKIDVLPWSFSKLNLLYDDIVNKKLDIEGKEIKEIILGSSLTIDDTS